MGKLLEIEARAEDDGTAVLSLIGEVDVSNVSQAREKALKLLEGGGNKMVVDIAGVTYMDSSGLGMLVGLLKRLKESGGKLAIAGAVERVRRLFEITGLEQIFALREDVAAALKEVRS